MAEYIERTALLKSKDWLSLQDFDKARAKAIILGRPAADVVEVVRCKDCEYWLDNNDGYKRRECRWGHYETPDADDYCSFGERIDDDG